jgi:prephenate dehydratase
MALTGSEKLMRIAYQGEPGAYSEAAALRFNPNAQMVPCERFEDVFTAVSGGQTTHGILPIENSTGGSIHRNYDLLVEHELPVVAEVLLQVSHHLLAFPGTRLADVKKVYSHPQGLAQCEGFLSSLKGVEIVATYDTAGSAKMIRDKAMKDAAAIASARAAEVFGLESLAAGIQDFKENITRFILISKDAADPKTADKTMIVFTLPNQPGALFKALSVFALRDIDLTKLESRPVRGRAFEYLFYADIAVPPHDALRSRIWQTPSDAHAWIVPIMEREELRLWTTP